MISPYFKNNVRREQVAVVDVSQIRISLKCSVCSPDFDPSTIVLQPEAKLILQSCNDPRMCPDRYDKKRISVRIELNDCIVKRSRATNPNESLHTRRGSLENSLFHDILDQNVTGSIGRC